ncbi:ABC transporter ATP-binding protein [Candidatus Bipolaricaulota bacterium]|nr:ABC transporter ATP-binding protein [Candidatus Bipolaricaulota bacterium]TFH10260.1 MAG: ABC transporter ATP-binding protein [Candidatus Atribacteria bacterium]
MKMHQALWQLIKYRPGLYTANALAWIVILLAELGTGIVAKLFFDSMTESSAAGLTLWSIIALVVAVGIARILTILVGALTDIHHRYNMGSLLRRNLLSSVLARPGAQSLGRSTGEALNTFRDDSQVVEDTISWIVDQMAFTVYAIVALGVLIAIDARITAIVVLPLLTVIAAARSVAKHIRRFREAARRATEKVTGAIGEAMEGVQAIQLAGAEKHVLSHVQELNKARLIATVRDRLLSQSFHSFFWNTATLCTGLILLAAADGLRAGTFTVGDFALFVIYVGVLAEFVAVIGDFMMHLKQGAVSMERMVELSHDGTGSAVVAHAPIHMHGPLPEVLAPRRTASDRLETLRIDHLFFSWPKEGCTEADAERVFALRDISFSLSRGEFVVITGRIGSGKSTLLRTLLGLLPMEHGSIAWNGRPVIDPAEFFVPPRCAYTPQVPQLFSDTLQSNIRMGLPSTPAEIEEALFLAVMEDDVPHLQAGLDTMIGAKGVKLSGGQRQRTAAARMFIRDPELLVFDDLSSALDVETENLLWDRTFSRGDRTALVVSHRRPALERADRIILLKDGAIEGIGALGDLMAKHEEMRSLWGSGLEAQA